MMKENEIAMKEIQKNRYLMEKFNALRALLAGAIQSQGNQHKNKESLWDKILNFFHLGKKTKHHSLDSGASSSESQASTDSTVVDDTIKSPEEEPTTLEPNIPADNNSKQTTLINLGGDEPTIEMQLNLQSSEPGVILSSSNPNDYKFLDMRNIDGVETETTSLSQPLKTKIAGTVVAIDKEAYTETAKEFGFDVQETKLENGKIQYKIVDPQNNNQAITADQMKDFKERSAENFNEIAARVCPPAFHLSKTISDATKQIQPTPSSKAGEQPIELIEKAMEKAAPSLSSLPDPSQTPTLSAI